MAQKAVLSLATKPMIDGFPFDLFYGSRAFRNWLHLGSETVIEWNTDDNWAGGTIFDPGGFSMSTNSKGDEIAEFSVPLRSDDPQTDSLNLENGKMHILGMCIELCRQGPFDVGPSFFDDWPGAGYTPEVCIHAEQFANFVIDLR